MKIFTREEIDLYLNTFGVDPITFLSPSIVAMLKLAYELHMDVTVDECRALMGTPFPHPDPAKGCKYIWESETDTPSPPYEP